MVCVIIYAVTQNSRVALKAVALGFIITTYSILTAALLKKRKKIAIMQSLLVKYLNNPVHDVLEDKYTEYRHLKG